MRLPTSAVPETMLANAPAETVTLAWLMGALRERSFGIAMLLIALVSLVPAPRGWPASCWWPPHSR